MNEFEDYMPSIVEVPDEVLAQWAEEDIQREEYYSYMNSYIDSELENEYYAQLENEYSKSE